MKAVKWMLLLAVWCFAFGVMSGPAGAAEPDYAKWGRVAMQETAKRYRMDIVDYKHLGRQADNSGHAVESFKLILKNGQRSFGVTVNIRFELQTEQILQIQFIEDHHSITGMNPQFRYLQNIVNKGECL
ncbi:DUF3889 domain-containing protein [Paenibacillus sp. GCM10027626]|uniref:DUF3889 domain-containing protein n=1 Tax=Paenibacillus sp. GCM10027626 TaxID=3273411 RepID=UPI00362D1955